MTDIVYLEIERPVGFRMKLALEDGLENAQELLSHHDRNLGRTTKKNKTQAKYYEAQITEFRQLIRILPF